MPRRNRNALRGGTRPPYDGQPVMTADESDGLDHLLRSTWPDFAADLGAATDPSAILANIYAQATASDGGRR